MKFDLTFLLNPNEKSSVDKSPKSMSRTHACSIDSNPVSHSDDTEGGNDHSILGASMGTTRSASIPLPTSHVPRTHSEVQLSIDQEAAEQRDARMFDRLVTGIRERQQHSYAASALPWEDSYENSISRIVQARLAPLDEDAAAARIRSSQDTTPPEEIFTANHHPDLLQDPSDAWSISGYDHEEQAPTYPSLAAAPTQDGKVQEGDYPEDEGLFEMDL